MGGKAAAAANVSNTIRSYCGLRVLLGPGSIARRDIVCTLIAIVFRCKGGGISYEIKLSFGMNILYARPTPSGSTGSDRGASREGEKILHTVYVTRLVRDCVCCV